MFSFHRWAAGLHGIVCSRPSFVRGKNLKPSYQRRRMGAAAEVRGIRREKSVNENRRDGANLK